MSEENLEIVRSILADWERGDYASVEWADRDIEFEGRGPDRANTRGLDALAKSWREFLRQFKHFATSPERFIDVDGERVLVLVRFHGHGRGSGAPLADFFGAQLFTLRNGRVVRLVLYSNREEALEAVGLSE